MRLVSLEPRASSRRPQRRRFAFRDGAAGELIYGAVEAPAPSIAALYPFFASPKSGVLSLMPPPVSVRLRLPDPLAFTLYISSSSSGLEGWSPSLFVGDLLAVGCVVGTEVEDVAVGVGEVPLTRAVSVHHVDFVVTLGV
jgi:hypothetical protein